ncbi:hypothetical protein TWF694_002099 [Orbilia ellipsospora]|uniref:Uncharacterized protein n=1 Tax=Orbilia ellipsospora TaxID=2528407 RepID=A0AAV9X4I1_9PEZI
MKLRHTTERSKGRYKAQQGSPSAGSNFASKTVANQHLFKLLGPNPRKASPVEVGLRDQTPPSSFASIRLRFETQAGLSM